MRTCVSSCVANNIIASHCCDKLKFKVTQLAFGREVNWRRWSSCLYARLRNAYNEGVRQGLEYTALPFRTTLFLILTTFSAAAQTVIGTKQMNGSSFSFGGGSGNTLYLWQCLALFPYCCLHWSSTVNVTPGISVGNVSGFPSAWILKHLLALELKEKNIWWDKKASMCNKNDLMQQSVW